MSRNTQEGRYAGKLQRHPWDIAKVVKDCRAGRNMDRMPLKEWAELMKKARKQ